MKKNIYVSQYNGNVDSVIFLKKKKKSVGRGIKKQFFVTFIEVYRCSQKSIEFWDGAIIAVTLLWYSAAEGYCNS